MSTPNETRRNPWVLPGLILWGFAPAILIATSILGGWTWNYDGTDDLPTTPVTIE